MGSQQSRASNTLRQGGTGDERVTIINIDDVPEIQDAGTNKMVEGLSRLLEANKNSSHDHNEKGLILLKQVFKKLDPAITYGATYRNQGQLELSFKYDRSKGVLLVRVIKGLALDAKSLRSSCARVYIKVFTSSSSGNRAPHEISSNQIIYRTKVVQGTLAPEFHEIFAFPITEEELENTDVICQAWNADIMEEDELIGDVTISISSLHLLQKKMQTHVYDLNAEFVHDVTGNLDVTLMYQLPQHLSVTINSASQLSNHYTEAAPNPMVKLQISGMKEIFKTKVHYDTVNPVWQETFIFSVTSQELKRRHLIFHVIDFDDVNRNRSLGQAIVNLGDLDLGSSYHGELKLADLKSGRHVHSNQAQNVALQEFKQSLVAHALAKCPNFLFKNQAGAKVVHVRNTKLHSQASLQLVGAIPVQ